MYKNRHIPRFGGVLLFAILVGGAAANHHDQYHVHRLEKAHIALDKRESGSCQSGWSSCAASAGGDCCPDNYACASTYCYATTAGPTTACYVDNYYNCPLSDGPGACCPVGFICGSGSDCQPPAGSSYSESCPANHFQCPSSLGYGCCQNGLACGISSCYSTNPTTYVVSSPVITTDSAGSTITSELTMTTVVTPTMSSVTLENPGAVPKLIPSTVAKLAAAETSSSSNGISLTQAELGGIIGGVVVVLITILVAAFVIVRRLRRTARIVEDSKRGSSGENQTRPSEKSGFGPPTVTDIDVSVDPLMQTPTIRPSRLRAESDTSTDLRHVSPARSAGLSSGHSTPPAWPGNYNPTSHHENIRHPSMESATGGYYDPARYSQLTQGVSRISYDSQATHQSHGRQWSDASEVDGAHGVSELDALDVAASSAARRRSSSSVTRPPPTPHARQNSDGGHQCGRSDSSVPAAAPLVTVSEVGELHGFYGPIDRQVGQTAATPQQGASKLGEPSSEPQQ